MVDKETTKYRRKSRRKESFVETLAKAQQIVFAPFTFQVIASMMKFGILDYLKSTSASIEEIVQNCDISKYTAKTLCEAALVTEIIELKDGKYSLTSLGDTFIDNEMTRVNFNFMRDVCYLGASELSNSFKEESPIGLKKYIGNYPTIYPALSKLPEQIQKSWYEFDHYYSDTCFDEVLDIIFKQNPKEIFDIGGNTGKFEKACLKYNPDCKVTMLDLPENIDRARENVNNNRCEFYGINVVSEKAVFPKMSGAVLMSQFLDCFSESQILSILTNVEKASDKNTHIYILEPFIDNQQFKAAEYSLVHISLYFTCMANGVSKMYSEKDMLSLIDEAGLKVKSKYSVGIHDYTLLECVKK